MNELAKAIEQLKKENHKKEQAENKIKQIEKKIKEEKRKAETQRKIIKEVFVFYGLNLLLTVFLAILFGGILGSIEGNELVLGLLIVLGVQLSPFVTTMIFRKIYKQKMEYTYEFNKYSIIACVLPIFLIVISAFVLSLSGIAMLAGKQRR